MKKYLTLLLTISIAFAINSSLDDLYLNDAPVWEDFPSESIDEDCENGCTSGEFLFDLEPYVSDPNEDDTIVINEPVLLLGSASVSIDSFILKIIPDLNYFGEIIVELTATDGELSSTTEFNLGVTSINDFPLINSQSDISIDEDCGNENCVDFGDKLELSLDNFDTDDVENPDNLTLHIDHDNTGNHYDTDGDLGIYIDWDYNGQITIPVYVEDPDGGQSDIFDCVVDVIPVNDAPYFENLGDIVIDEDQVYEEFWVWDLSSGAYNEEDNLEFTITFDENTIIENYSLSSDGNLIIEPIGDAYGSTWFSVYLSDGDLQSELVISTYTLNSVNDLPVINNQIEVSINEDCDGGLCDESNKLVLSLDDFDTDDIENPDDLVLYIDQDDIGDDYSTDGGLGIFFNEDFNGQITVPVYIEDPDGGQSDIFDCVVDVLPVNDAPYFQNLGDITIDEDQVYNDVWAINISSGADNESDNLEFTIIFDENTMIENYSLSSDGNLIIDPIDNANGSAEFSVYLSDGDLQSDLVTSTYTLNSDNDLPIINSQNSIDDLEDCDGDLCNESNKLVLSLDDFDTYDVENPDDLVLYIDQDSIGDDYTTDGGLGIFFNEDFNGQITVPVYIEDPDGGQSDIFDCVVDVLPVNDTPYFSNLGDITIDEDEVYNELWAFDISTGAGNENEDIFFIITFDDTNLIEDYSITPDGLLIITPSLNLFGATTFTVKIVDEEFSESDELTYLLTINSVNDIPLINFQQDISINEDCNGETCDGNNKLVLSLDNFDTDDVENPDDLILYIDQDNIENHYMTDGGLGIIIEQDFNGQITIPIYVEDPDGGQSNIFNCIVGVIPVNDIPYFYNLGDIVMNEDCSDQICNENNRYNELWAYDVSAGGDNWNLYENQDISFIITFTNPELISYYSLTYTNDNTGRLIIELVEHANGSTDFDVLLEDEEGLQSVVASHNLTINAINDAPSFSEYVTAFDLDEDTGQHTLSWAYDISPGGGNGIYEENDQVLEFIIEDGYDESLFSENPQISITENEGVLSFALDDNMNGQTAFSVFLQDNGDNSNGGENLSNTTIIDININQVNDLPKEFLVFPNLENYQEDLSTFYIDEENTYFRYPYQPVYIDGQTSNSLRFEWEWVDSLDIDTYPDINKDILMENVYYRLEMLETNNLENVIVLSDNLIYGDSNSDIAYETDYENGIVRIDIDLTSFSDQIDLTGNTEYHWRVVSQNYQSDIYDNDPDYNAIDEDYSFYTDLTLPTADMVYLHDDIFEEHFDLYMLGNEQFIDFDGFNRPVKLWVYYNSQQDTQPEIFFPELYDSLNNIYYLSHNFIYSGDINFTYQTRDKVQNINQGSHDVSFGIINPISLSTINFSNNLLRLEIPEGATNDMVSCLISSHKNNDSNIDIVGDIFQIIPENIALNKPATLSFNLDMIATEYNYSDLAIYTLESDIWVLTNTYIQDDFIKTEINSFGNYAIAYNENHETNIFPNDYILNQNYPNPFNPETTINYYLPSSNFIILNIYNIEGQKVKTLYNGYSDFGYHQINWDGKNDNNSSLPSGVYILSLQYDNNILNSKMVKIK